MQTAIQHARQLARWCKHLWAEPRYSGLIDGITDPIMIARVLDSHIPESERSAPYDLPDGLLCPRVDEVGNYVHESAGKRIAWRVGQDWSGPYAAKTTVWISSGSRSFGGPGVPGHVAVLVVDRRTGDAALDTVYECRADWAQLAIEAAEALGVAANPGLMTDTIAQLRTIVAESRQADKDKVAGWRAERAAAPEVAPEPPTKPAYRVALDTLVD